MSEALTAEQIAVLRTLSRETLRGFGVLSAKLSQSFDSHELLRAQRDELDGALKQAVGMANDNARDLLEAEAQRDENHAALKNANEQWETVLHQRDAALARVAGLEATITAIDVHGAPHAAGCAIEKWKGQVVSMCDCWKRDALAALSADPLKMGEAHVEIGSLFFAVLNALDDGLPTIMGLPCICGVEYDHAAECLVIRDACTKRDRLSAAMKGDR